MPHRLIEVPQGSNRFIRVPGDYPTITQALSVAQAGDTVQVATGTYREGTLGMPAGVRLIGTGWQSTTIDGNGANVVIYAGPDSLIEGFTIQGSGPSYFDAGIWISQGSITVRQNRITGNSAGVWAWCFDPDTCAIHVTIEGNIVDKNSSNGINSNEHPIFEVRNNTVVGNGGGGVILNNAAGLAENNIIVANASDGLASNAGATVRYNDVWSNGRDYVGGGPGAGGLSMDPLFRDMAGGDYRLHAGSPAVGHGTPAGTDLGALPFTPVGNPPASVTLAQVGESLWDVSWPRTTAAGYYVYYGPCTRQTAAVVDVGLATTHRLYNVDVEGVGYVAVSAYDGNHRESIVRLADGIHAPCPTAPRNLEVGAFPGGLIRLQWQDTSSLEEGFQVERAQVPLSPTTYSLIATLPANTTVYTDTPPLLEETYWYRVRAYNANGPSPYSNESYNATFDQVPNLDEQYLLVLINEARADPGAFGYPHISPVPPLAYNALLNYAAHSHSQAILNSGFQFGHCDPAGRCPTERAHAVGYQGGVGENLIQGMTGPEWVESSNQAFMNSEGHRNNMLCRCFNEAGLGHTYDPAKGGNSYWKGQYTETFSGREGIIIPHLPSGVVVPYTGDSPTEFTYIVNYYHAEGYAPTEALAYIDNLPHSMTLSTGAPGNGSYRYTTTLPPGFDHQYYFYFTFPGGSARLPESGSYNYPDVEGDGLPPTFTPTLTPRPTSTPTPTSTAGPTRTPTKTPRGYKLRLPLVVKNQSSSSPTPTPTLPPGGVDLVGHVDGLADALVVQGRYAYVAHGPVWDGDQYVGRGQVQIVDIANPATPVVVAIFECPLTTTCNGSYETELDLSELAAYVPATQARTPTDSRSGVLMIHLANPVKPSYGGFFDTTRFSSNDAASLDVSESYLYIGLRRGLLILDISRPLQPRQVGFASGSQRWGGKVRVFDQYAYSVGWQRLHVVDVSDPSHPRLVGFYDTGSAKDVFVAGDYAYVAEATHWENGEWVSGGLRVVDVSNPAVPHEVSFYDTPGSANGVFVARGYAYVADGSAGLRVVDISNPAAPREVNSYDTGWAEAIFVVGDYVYVASGSQGLFILRHR